MLTKLKFYSENKGKIIHLSSRKALKNNLQNIGSEKPVLMSPKFNDVELKFKNISIFNN